jgi:hypothetical protein
MITTYMRAALGAAVLATSTSAAQSALRLPASARALGMGNVAIAGRDDDVLFYNPAQLTIARGMSVSGERYASGARTAALSSVTRVNTAGIALGAVLFQSPSPITSVGLTAGFAQVVKSLRLGAAVDYDEENRFGARESETLFDAGISRDFARYFTGGFAVQHFGGHKTNLFGRYPTRATLGLSAAAPAGPYDLVFTTAASMESRRRVRAAGGGEINWSWLEGYNVALRAGLRDPFVGERPFTAGAGFTKDRLSIDYALETLAGSHIGHRVGLRVR